MNDYEILKYAARDWWPSWDASKIVYIVEDSYSQIAERERRFKAHYRPEDFLREHATISIMLPRQSGHTTAALTLLYNHKKAVMLCRNNIDRIHVLKLARGYIMDEAELSDVEGRLYMFNDSSFRGRHFGNADMLIIDGSHFEKIDDKMPLWLASFNPRFVVKLQ